MISNNMITQQNIIRPLGGYERLLSRVTPGTSSVSLSHGACYEIKGCIPMVVMEKAIGYCMRKHPILHSYIIKTKDNDKLQYFSYCKDSIDELSRQVLQTVEVASYEELQDTWKKLFNSAVNAPSFPEEGPQWKLTNIIYNNPEKRINESAWVFCFNHGIDDQGSVNILVNDILHYCHQNGNLRIQTKQFPPSIEEAIAPGLPNLLTLLWSLLQLYNSLTFPAMLPFRLDPVKRENVNEYNSYGDPNKRTTFLKVINISPEETKALVDICRERGVKVTYALSAAMLLATSAYIQENGNDSLLQDLKLRFLLSVGLRPYASKSYKESNAKNNDDDFTDGTVACAAGAIDYIMKISSKSTSSAQSWTGSDSEINDLFEIAKTSKALAEATLQFVPESVRLFGLGMQYVDILRVVEMDAKNTNTMGRGFSCGVSNMGIVKLNKAHNDDGDHLFVKAGYYGTSHSRNGVLCQLSCMTINNSFQGCLQFTHPLISYDEADIFTKRFERIIRSISHTKLRKQNRIDDNDYDIVCNM